MHVDIGNPSLSWALSSGWPSLNSPRNPKPRDPELPNIKGAKKNLWQSVMGSWVRGQQTIAPSFFAGCFLVTSWLNWQLELYPWHSVVWSPSVLSPLHCGWSSIGKSSIFFFPPCLTVCMGLEIVIFLFPLYLSMLFKRRPLERELVVFFPANLALSPSHCIVAGFHVKVSNLTLHAAVVHMLTSSGAHC